MEYQQKILITITVLLVALALYLTISAEKLIEVSPQVEDTSEAKALLIKGIEFGKGQQDYVYSYSKISDDFETLYMLTKKGDERIAVIESPLSKKKVFFLSNDTILCVSYPKEEEEICSSVKNDSRLDVYIRSVDIEFFSDSLIRKNKNNMEYIIANNITKLNPQIKNRTIGNETCSEINYTLDYNNITINEAALFGIGSNSPKFFMRTMCVNNDTGYKHEETLEYSHEGMTHNYLGKLYTFSPSVTEEIVSPPNLSIGAVDRLFSERQQHDKLVGCFIQKRGEDRDRCINTIALTSRQKNLCGLAGKQKDRCLVSLVPLIKDETLCPAVTDPTFKDDCYIELAGAYKNSTFCSNIQNTSRIDYCIEVATPWEPEPPEEENETNESGGLDVMSIMESLDNEGRTETDNANETGNPE